MIDAIDHERAHLLALVAQLGREADRRTVTDEGWTAKDVVAHLIHWTGQMAWGLGAAMEPPAWVAAARGKRIEGDGAWNAIVVAHHRAMPLDDVVREFDRNVDLLLQQLRARDDVDIDASARKVMPWAAEVPLRELLARETYEHFPVHAATLERALAGSA